MPPDAHARLHLYFGPDDFSMRDAYRALRAALDEDGMLDTNTTVLPARGLKPQELIQHAATVPFLAQARMVVVEGLVGALGGGKGVAETWQPLLDALPTLPETSHIVLLEPVTPGNRGREQSTRLARSALMKALRAVEGVDAQEFRELTIFGRNGQESPLARWAHERAEERGIAIERPAVAELVDLVGANLWALASELEKLSRYAADRAVTVEDVRLLTPQAREESIFAIVDAVVEGRAAPALKLIRAMLDEGPERPPQIQAMIARQLRNLVRATELLAEGAPQPAVGEATGVRNSFALGKLMRQAGATTRETAEASLRAVEASDHAVKTGRIDDTLALDLLVMRLATLARRPAAAGGR